MKNLSLYGLQNEYLQRLARRVNRVLYKPLLVKKRILCMEKCHSLTCLMLWDEPQAEYDRLKRLFSKSSLVSLPTATIADAQDLDDVNLNESIFEEEVIIESESQNGFRCNLVSLL